MESDTAIVKMQLTQHVSMSAMDEENENEPLRKWEWDREKKRTHK